MRFPQSPFSGLARDRILAETVRRLSDRTERRLAELERGAVEGLAARRSPERIGRSPLRPQLRVSVGVTVFADGDFLWRCLDSVAAAVGYDQLILIYDGEDLPLASRLRAFAQRVGAECQCHDRTLGYTASANQILMAATGDVVVLLNSDTVVPHGWIDRLLVPFGDPRTGLVGPWSNAATSQSVPELPAIAGYAANDLPGDVDVEVVNAALAAAIAPESPVIPAVNGFCLAIRRELIQAIGLFDGSAFAEAFGEELDYALRAAAAGFCGRVADTLYVHHVKSQSFGVERRKLLSALGKDVLRRLYGDDEVARLLTSLLRWSETVPQRTAVASLLRGLAGGGPAPLPGIRVGVFADGDGGPGFRAVSGLAADGTTGSPPFVLAQAPDHATAFDIVAIRAWRDLAPAAALADGVPIVHVAASGAELDDALNTPAARAALQDGRIRRHFCLDAAAADLLFRNLAIRAAVLPDLNTTPAGRMPSLLLIDAGAGPVSATELAAALAAESNLTVAILDAGKATPRGVEQAIRSADYCLDLRPEHSGWRGALRAFRLGAIPLLLTDDGLGEIVEAEVGDIVLAPRSAGTAELAAAIARSVAAGAGAALGAASGRARPLLPAGWFNALSAGSTPALRRAAPPRLMAAE